MEIVERAFKGVFDVNLTPFADHRGVLTKLFNHPPFTAQGFDIAFRQILHSQTTPRNTVRGMYVQLPPYTESKMIYPIRGRLVWVVVDLRKDSPTFKRAELIELDSRVPRAVLIKSGFAHGSVTLEDDVHVLLAGDNVHSEAHGVGIAWNDPDLGIPWPLLPGVPVVISPVHARYGSLSDFCATCGGL